MLEVRDVSVAFGGVRALDGVSLRAEQGAVSGLIGPNGAGKTTLFNVITGLEKPKHGTVFVDEKEITRLSAAERARTGLSRTFQRIEIFGGLTVRENVLVAAELYRSWSHKQDVAPGRIADALLERLGLSEVADVPADVLPTGLARLVELAPRWRRSPRCSSWTSPAVG